MSCPHTRRVNALPVTRVTFGLGPVRRRWGAEGALQLDARARSRAAPFNQLGSSGGLGRGEETGRGQL